MLAISVQPLYASRCSVPTYGAWAGTLVSGWASGSWEPLQGAVNQAGVTQKGWSWHSQAAIAQPWHKAPALAHVSFGQHTSPSVRQTSYADLPVSLRQEVQGPLRQLRVQSLTSYEEQTGIRGLLYGNYGRCLEGQHEL